MGFFFDKECKHKWIDFPIQVESNYCEKEGYISASVNKTYVCRLCKERKDVNLTNELFYKRKEQSFSDFSEEVSKKLDKDYPGPSYKEVEEAINDFIYLLE